MRAREFYEDDEDPSEIAKNTVAKFYSLLEFINTNCRPWLEQTDGGAKVVWRGMHGRPKEMLFRGAAGGDDWIAGVRDVPKNRDPKDTPRKVHDMFNEILSDMGISANRSNSLFVSGNPSTATGYGDRVFVIMPVGDFKFAWNTKISDLYSEWQDVKHELTIPDEEVPQEAYMRYWDDALERIVLPDIKKQMLDNLANQKVIGLKVDFHKRDIEELKRIYDISAIYTNQGKPSQYMSKTALVNAILKDKKLDFLTSFSLQQEAEKMARVAMTKAKLTPEQHRKVRARALQILKNNDGYGKYMSKDKVRDRLMKDFKDTDLIPAIDSGNEIIIECDQYLMISKMLWEDVLSKIFVEKQSADDVIGGKHESE